MNSLFLVVLLFIILEEVQPFGPFQQLAPGQTILEGSLPTGGSLYYTFNGFRPEACFGIREDATFDLVYGWFSDNETTLLNYADFELRGTVSPGGNIKLGVTGWANTAFTGSHSRNGTFRLNMTVAAVTDDGDSVFDSSVQLPLGQTNYLSNLYPVPTVFGSTCSGSSDVDFVTFSLPVGACWSTQISRSFDEIFGLFAPDGTLIKTADSSLNGVVDSTGKVHIAISGWNDNQFNGTHTYTGNYNLTIVTQTTGEQNDNTFATRNILTAGVTTVSGDMWALTGNCQIGDTDFYQFSLAPGVCAQTSIVRNFDEIFGLFHENGTLLQTADSQISGRVPETGNWIIAISGWNDNRFVGSHSYNGNYTLTINTFSTSQDGNNNFLSAVQVDGASTRSYVSTLESNSSPCSGVGDVDFVTFSNLPAGNCFYTLMNRNFDEVLGWYDNEGTLIEYSDSQIVGKVPANGIVTIAVSAWADLSFIGSHSSSGNYNLTIVTVPPPASDLNDNFDNRTILASGITSYSSNLAAQAAAPCNVIGDIDFLEFQATAGACFSTDVSSNFDDMVGWVDSNNGSILQVLDSSNIQGIVPDSGKLVLAVTAYSDFQLTGTHSRSGNYTLNVTITVPQNDQSESPLSPIFAVAGVAINADLYASNPACGGGDKDFYFYVLPAGSCFYTVQNVTFDEYMGAFYANGTLFAQNDNALSGFVPADGVLIVGITGYPDSSFVGAHSRSGNYRLTVNTETITPDGDNTFQSRKIFTNTDPVSGSIGSYTHCSGGDIDFLTFTNLTPGACYQTQIMSNFSSGQYILGHFAENGTLLDYTYSQFTDVVPSSGQLTFAISGSGDTSFLGTHSSRGTYTFTLNITTNSIISDGNNDFASATIIPEGVTTYSSDLYAFVDTTPCTQDNGNSDVDFLQFTVKSKCDVILDVDSSIDTYLGYYLENGTRATSTDSNQLEIKAPDSGVITFAITAWPDTNFVGGHSRSGNYNLTLTLDCGNAPDGFDRVTSGGSVTSSLSSGEVEMWTFEQQTAGYCYVTNMDTSFDAVLGLYSDDGVLIDWDDYSLMGIVPNSSQVNIAVSGWADTEFVGDHTRSGPYTLSLTLTHNEPPPASDGNDSFEQRVVVNGTEVSGSIWATIDQTPCPDDSNTVNDVDYFQFVGLPAGYCAATRMDETFDSALALLDNNGDIAIWEDYNIYAIVPSSGIMNIAVTGYPDRQLTGEHQKNGNYTLNIDLTRNQPAPASDGNNNFFTPTVVSGGGITVSGSIWSLSDQTPCPNDFTAMGDVDFIRFGPFTPGDCFQTQVTASFDEYLGWYNNQGELIDDEDYQITGIVPSDGFLYIAVSGYPDRTFIGNHNSNGNYTLTINLSRNTPPPAADGNERFNSSTMVSAGQTSVSGSIWATIDQTPCPNDHNTVNDVDFYTFSGLPAGSCFQTTEDADFDQVTGWFNSSGGLVDWADYTLTGVIPSDGSLHIAVSGWADTVFVGNHQHNGNYTLALTITKNDEPGEMADNQFSGRVTLDSGVRKASGDIWYIRDRTPCPNDLPPSDVDFFTFTGLPAGVCFRTSTDTNFDTIIGWYRNDGLQATWSDSEIYGVVPSDGVVHLALSGWADWNFVGDHTNGGRYTVTIVLDEVCGGSGSGSAGQSQWCSNNCQGRTCGSNGCGGSCGTCSTGLFCLSDGTCSASCTTTCSSGQECGSDGCGGSCGVCSGSQDVCSGGLCTCVADCTGRVCGDDGCGGSCGTCPGSQDQCFDGVCRCVADCSSHECGSDGCGGICGTCGPYYTCGDNNLCVRDSLTQPSCDEYFGLPHNEVSLVLLNEVNDLLREKILETIDNLESMRDALLAYDPESQLLNLASLIDQIHLFCSGPYHNDTCLSLSELEFIETAFLNAIHVVTVDPLSECAGRVCGFTSYGGSCGSCPTGQDCTEDGQCICSYDCTDRVCDNARQEEGTSLTLCPPRSCGSCADRYECTNYQCTPVPHPPITIRLLDCDSQAQIAVDGQIDILADTYFTSFLVGPNSNTTWIPDVQEGTFNFSLDAIGYISISQDLDVEFTTTGIDFCLNRDTVMIEIRDASSGATINQPCSVNYTVDSRRWETNTPPNPWVHTIPDYGYGTYTFDVKCEGYNQETKVDEIDSRTNNVYINVDRTPIMISVIDCESGSMVNVQHELHISSTFDAYETTIQISKQTTVEWVPPSVGTYDFMSSAIGYEASGESRTIDYPTTELVFCISRSTFLVGVQDINTREYVNVDCTITWNPPTTSLRSTSITPPNPTQLAVPDEGYGVWSWTTSCNGYLESSVELPVTEDTTLIILFVSPPPVDIDVRDIHTDLSIGLRAEINYNGVASGSFSWNGVTSFEHSGFGTYTFTAVPDSTYQTGTTTVMISSTTTMVIIYVAPNPIQIDVRDSFTDRSITIDTEISFSGVSSGSFNWNGITSFEHSGYGTYTFVAVPESTYESGTVTVSITSTTTMVIIYVGPPPLRVDVRDRLTDASISVGATVSYTGVSSGSFRWTEVTLFTHSGYGTYSFSAQPDSSYESGTTTVSVSSETTLIIIYVSPLPVQIDVRDRQTNNSITIGTTINYSGVDTGSFRWTGVTSFTHSGYGSYTFVASPDTSYSSGTVTTSITSSTTLIIIFVDAFLVQVDVRDQATNSSITVPTTVSYSGVATGSFRWTGVTSFTHSGYGSYTFIAAPDNTFNSGTSTVSITSTTSLVIIYVTLIPVNFCGDGTCSGTETATFCPEDCVALFLEFENSDGSGPVNGATVNYFNQDPRTVNPSSGPNRNSVQPTHSRTTGSASNTVLEETTGYNQIVYMETVVEGFINFYWTANTSTIDPILGVWRLRAHLSTVLTASSYNYRFVNTWKPIDATPEPFGPTDLNLHLFHSAGALDINNPTLVVQGFSIGQAVADSKQSGGPATLDISPESGVLVAVWNSKPPRSSAIAPSQNNRYLVDSGSYIVIYGKTVNAASGKQLGQIVLDDLFINNPSMKSDRTSDLWFAAHFTAVGPGQDQPTITSIGKLKASTINSARDMIFDCEVYTYCSSFRVPYSDTGR